MIYLRMVPKSVEKHICLKKSTVCVGWKLHSHPTHIIISASEEPSIKLRSSSKEKTISEEGAVPKGGSV
jgi:hypothetical protein